MSTHTPRPRRRSTGEGAGMKPNRCLYCFENGRTHKYRTRDCITYPIQQSWNRKMKRIFAQDGKLPIPEAPDYSLKALREWTVSQSMIEGGGPNTWWKEVHTLLRREPKSWRGFTFMPKGEVI